MTVDKWAVLVLQCSEFCVWRPCRQIVLGDSSAGSDILIPRLRHSEFLQLFQEIKSIPSSVTHSQMIQMSYWDCIPLHSHCSTCVLAFCYNSWSTLKSCLFCHFPTDWQQKYIPNSKLFLFTNSSFYIFTVQFSIEVLHNIARGSKVPSSFKLKFEYLISTFISWRGQIQIRYIFIYSFFHQFDWNTYISDFCWTEKLSQFFSFYFVLSIRGS